MNWDRIHVYITPHFCCIQEKKKRTREKSKSKVLLIMIIAICRAGMICQGISLDSFFLFLINVRKEIFKYYFICQISYLTEFIDKQ